MEGGCQAKDEDENEEEESVMRRRIRKTMRMRQSI